MYRYYIIVMTFAVDTISIFDTITTSMLIRLIQDSYSSNFGPGMIIVLWFRSEEERVSERKGE